jgi:maltooligosyltrehalose trehalohydrolase
MPDSLEGRLNIGPRVRGGAGTDFTVWAPFASDVCVKLMDRPVPLHRLERRDFGYFSGTVPAARAGDRYLYRLDGAGEWPDPASRFQPNGVHDASEVIDPGGFQWSDQAWRGLALDRFIIYELHVGTFTRHGTFQGVISRLDDLCDLGVTAIELMPVAQFPGSRNWGYDGVFLFAPQSTYGGPEGLQALVDACHRRGLAVILDVVYNHLGPEGNVLGQYGPYFTDRYRTPWGSAINYDGPDSDAVRHFIVSNALQWITDYHIDALRLDAIHGIYDFSARHILGELADAVHERGRELHRTVHLIAESDLNDVKVIGSREEGGHELDGQWSDDFHHSLHALTTGERLGYYEDFGDLKDLATALEQGFVYAGRYSRHRRRRHGNSCRHRPPRQLVICAQNHDQVGNRAFGDRLSTLIPWEALKVCAAAVLLAPHTPLLFMGEEFGETAPFQYFVDHGDAGLIEAVRQGRRREFEAFGWSDVPDPQAPETFERSHIRDGSPLDDRQHALLAWYRRLIDVRQSRPEFRADAVTPYQHRLVLHDHWQVLVLQYWHELVPTALLVLSFNQQAVEVSLDTPPGSWRLSTASWNKEFGGNDHQPAPEHMTVGAQPGRLWVPPYGAVFYTNVRLPT